MKPVMNRYSMGVCCVVLSAAGFAVMPILAKYAYEGGANVSTVLFLRFAMAALLFGLYLAARRRLKVAITRSQWLALALYGGGIYALISFLYFLSLQYISGPLATLLLYTSPLFVVLLSAVIEKTSLSRVVVGAVLLSLVGLGLVLGTDVQTSSGYGVLLAIGSAVGYAAHIVLMKRKINDLPPFVTSAYVILFTALAQLLSGLATQSLDFQFDASALWAILGLSLASTILALSMFFVGLQVIGSTNAAILSMLEPIFTIVLAAVLLGETFTALQVLGTALVLMGAAIVVRTPPATKKA